MTLRTFTIDPALVKIVPLEPTDKMLGTALRHVDGMASMPSAWHAMLAAVPDALPGVIEHSGEPAGPIELQDNNWYMVRLDDGVGEIEAPAKYKSNVDCWYSYEFSGIPTWQLEVLWAVRQHVTEPSAPAQPAERQELSDDDIDLARWSCPTPLPQSTDDDSVIWTKAQVRAFARAIIQKDRGRA